jgi:hypothetical protein
MRLDDGDYFSAVHQIFECGIDLGIQRRSFGHGNSIAFIGLDLEGSDDGFQLGIALSPLSSMITKSTLPLRRSVMASILVGYFLRASFFIRFLSTSSL